MNGQLRDDLDFTRAFGSMPEGFERRVQHTLRRIEEEKPMKRNLLRTAVIVLILMTFATAAFAAVFSKTVDLFGLIYGQDKLDELNAGELVISGKAHRLGDVVYTLEDAVWTESGLYATVTARAAEGANLVLIPEDFLTDDPAGYVLHLTDEDIPEDAPTYRQLAEASGAKIMQVKAHFMNAIDPQDEEIMGDSGSLALPQPDGSVTFACEFYPMTTTMERLRAGECVVQFHLAVYEKNLDGEFIDGTLQVEEWSATIVPEG